MYSSSVGLIVLGPTLFWFFVGYILGRIHGRGPCRISVSFADGACRVELFVSDDIELEVVTTRVS